MKLILSFLLSTILIFPQKTNIQQEIESLNLSSKNYILYSVDADEVLSEKNSNRKLSAASINKILTSITALDLLEDEELDKVIEIDPVIFESVSPLASTAELIPYQKLSIKEVLYGIMLPSGADATSLMSHYLTGTHQGLVDKMNEKAQKIGMLNTHITNTSGLDDSNQYTTLNDLLKLLTYALKNEDFKEIYSTKEHTFIHRPDLTIENQILKQAEKVGFTYLYGAKSGFTTEANFSLSSVAKNEVAEYIFISTQADGVPYINNEAFNDAIKLYSYLFESYAPINLKEKDSLKAEVKIKNRFSPYELLYQEDLKALASSSFHEEDIEHRFIYETDLEAPIKENTLLGIHQIFYHDELIYQEDLYNTEPITRGFIFQTIHILKFLVPLILVLTIILIINRRRRGYQFKKKHHQI